MDLAAKAHAELLRLDAMRYEAEADAKAEIADVEGALKFGSIELEEWAPKALAELDQIRRYVASGFSNLVSHPRATINATLEAIGGGFEAVGGVALGVVTSETVVGAVVGGAAAVDGGSHVASGIGDLASIFNGNMNAVGTHNPLKNAFEALGGESGSTAYEVMSFGLSFAAPESIIAHAGGVEHLVGMTPIVDAAMGVSQKVRELWEGLRRYRFPFERVQVVTSDGHVVSVWVKGEKGSTMQMAKVEGETGRGVATEARLAKGTGRTKPLQMHHFATNKSKTYTSQIEKITKRYGLDLDEAWNKQLMPHQGRHPNAYHEYVLENLKQFDAIARGDKARFLKLFEKMKQEIINNPEMLYKDYWKNR